MLVGGAPAGKPARLVDPGEAVVLVDPPRRFVSRGGEKLDAALERFGIDVRGRRVLDAGASTGGFTDCVLQRGAVQVVAVDVGRGQLHERLRADPRVLDVSRTDVRDLDPAALGGPFPLVVADLSFISLRLVLDPLLALCTPGGDLVVLIKPQFEAGRAEADRGRGVIRDPAVWASVLTRTIAAVEGRGAIIMGLMVSPIRGAAGNVEFFLHARPRAGTPGPARAVGERDVARVVAEAAGAPDGA